MNIEINLKKTNYMIVKSPKKIIDIPINITLPDTEVNNYSLERKDHIKYLGLMVDDKINRKHHILPRQLYYKHTYPYNSCAVVALENTSKSITQRIKIKQNHLVGIIFFTTLYIKNTESPLPLLTFLIC